MIGLLFNSAISFTKPIFSVTVAVNASFNIRQKKAGFSGLAWAFLSVSVTLFCKIRCLFYDFS
tara:strand:- start:47770 stop:47958 length:189 start_codon:yes stop_codon:yes gene_type:complete